MKMRILDLQALLSVPYVEPFLGFEISPDGSQVAFSHNQSGHWEIYLALLDGSDAHRQITAGAGGKFAPRWSPDGRRLAYALDLDGGELYDICVYDPATGQHSNLTPNSPDTIQPYVSWSPDGRRLAFVSDRSGSFDTFVMDAAGGPARPVHSLPFPDREPRWSPNGRWLAVVSETRGQDFGTFIVPVQGGGTARPITDSTSGPGHDPMYTAGARWSPDSAYIAFVTSRGGQREIGVFDLATSHTTSVTTGPGDKEQLAWAPDGQRLAYVHQEGPVKSLGVLDMETGEAHHYQVEQGIYYRPSFTPDGEHVAFVFDSPRHPQDLWLLSLADGSFRQLTHSLPTEMDQSTFAFPTQVAYPSLDGKDVPALLYLPEARPQPPPAVIYVHGGPNWLTQFTWAPTIQHMVSRGWAVLAPNYRGSTGYGREWQLANQFDLGGGDTSDVVAGADYLVREGVADPKRIAVTGASYGGYLTMTSLTQYPDRWAAGSAVVPFMNWFTEFESEREDLQHWDLENFGHPEKDRDLYHERSPFFFLDRITAPVQLICGAHDGRCPASESEQARDVLLGLGRRCDLLIYTDEGHGFLKTENVIDFSKQRVAFLAETLEGE